MAREDRTFEFSCIVKGRVLRVRGAIYRPALIDADIALAYKPVQNGRLVRASQIRDASSASAAPTTDWGYMMRKSQSFAENKNYLLSSLGVILLHRVKFASAHTVREKVRVNGSGYPDNGIDVIFTILGVPKCRSST